MSQLSTLVDEEQLSSLAHHDEKFAPESPANDAEGLAAISPLHPSQFPDGGTSAYLSLLGGFCCLFCSFGWLNCLGVFQNYYQQHQLSAYPSSTIAWIPSVQIFVFFIPGPLVGWFNDCHGPRWLLVGGAVLHVLGLMMASLCKEYWQFMLAQGVCSPLGLSCIFQAGTSAIPTWFLKRRGLAFGVMAAGSGLGGVIFPIMASHLIPQVGFGWTMRIIAFTILAMMVVACVTVTSRLPPRPRSLTLQVLLEPFKDTNFNLLTLAAFLFFFGLFVPINFIEVQALNSGMSARLAGYLLPVLNALSIFGRIIPGFLADTLGRFNMQVLFCTIAGIVVLALGIPASNNAAFIVYAALYGFSSGAFVSLLPAQIAHISPVERIGVNVGVTFACISFAGLVGAPIAGAIVDANGGKFWGLNLFSGIMLLAGALMFGVTRMGVAGWQLAKKI